MHGEEKAIELCEAEGIVVDFCDFRDLTGVLVRQGQVVSMGIREDLGEPEMVRVILHELGHYHLHFTNRFTYRCQGLQHLVSGEEKEADFFAFCLAADHIRERVRWNFIDYGKE